MRPDIEYLCLAGERAFENAEYEEAEAWYELACTGRYVDPMRTHAFAPFVHDRFKRWEELRAMMYQRSVRRLAKPDQGHVFAVQTVPSRAGCYPVRAVLDHRMSTYGGGRITVITDHERQGQAKTFFKILRWAAECHPFTALTLVEDDVVFAKNAIDYIFTTHIDDDLAFISWFSTNRCLVPRLPPLLHCIEARDYMFNQAITFPARTVHELLASDALKNWSEPHGADRIYKDVFPDRKVAIHFPSLVDHVGGSASLVGNNHHGPRAAPTFIGEDADALALVNG